MIHGTPKKFIFIHSISIPQYYRLFMCLRKLTSDQKIQKSTQTIHTYTQQNEHTAGFLSFQFKYRSKRHYNMFRVSKIAKFRVSKIAKSSF